LLLRTAVSAFSLVVPVAEMFYIVFSHLWTCLWQINDDDDDVLWHDTMTLYKSCCNDIFSHVSYWSRELSCHVATCQSCWEKFETHMFLCRLTSLVWQAEITVRHLTVPRYRQNTFGQSTKKFLWWLSNKLPPQGPHRETVNLQN